MKSKLIKVILLVLCVIMAVALISCSQRQEGEYEGPKVGITDPTNSLRDVEVMSQKDANVKIRNAVNNMDLTTVSDAEWLNIDFQVSFKFTDKSKEPLSEIDYLITVKANINLLNNMNSEMYFVVKDVFSGNTVLGLYYFEAHTYLDIYDKESGDNKKYYMKEFNLSQVGKMLSETLTESNINISYVIGMFLAGAPNFGSSDSAKQIADIVRLAITMNIIYDSSLSTVHYDESGDTQYISHTLKANDLLGYVKNGLKIGNLLDFQVSWEAFGLPNLDPLLKMLLGFDLQTIKDKDWPVMSAQLSAINKLQDVVLADSTTKKDYVFSGMGVRVTCPEIDNGYDLDIQIAPLSIKTSNKKTVPISFANLTLGTGGQDTTYQRGSLGNLEINAALFVENEANSELTLRKVLGDYIDLGAVGDIPLKFKEQSEYRFDINAKVALDMFDNRNTKAEILINFNGEQFIRGYLLPDPSAVASGAAQVENILYLDLSALKGMRSDGKIDVIIPNISISGINIKSMLFEELLGKSSPILTRPISKRLPPKTPTVTRRKANLILAPYWNSSPPI